MNSDPVMKRLCDLYIRHAGLIGALYAVVPALLTFGVMLVVFPFRSVYLVRLVLALAVGVTVGAYVNRFGLSLWIVKHRSPAGPSTLIDGALIGAAVGLGCNLLPPLTSFIQTNHPEQARLFVLAAWGTAVILGGLIGLALAAVGRKHIGREWPRGQEQPS